MQTLFPTALRPSRRRCRVALFLLLLPLLPGLAGCSLHERIQDSRHTRVFKKMAIEADLRSQVAHNLQQLNTLLPRRSGTEAGARAEDVAYLLLKAYGYKEVELQSFPFLYWQEDSTRLRLRTPLKDFPYPVLEAQALPYSPSARIEAPLVDAGAGLVADYDRLQVEGALVLISAGPGPDSLSRAQDLPLACKVAFALAQGAVGVVAIAPEPGIGTPLPQSASLDNRPTAIPAVLLPAAQGEALRRALQSRAPWQRPLTLALHTEVSLREARARNVIATLPATKNGPKLPKLVVGAALDLDGAGAAAVIELARLLRELRLPTAHDIDFVLFNAAQTGHLGAQAYVAGHPHIGYYIDLDLPAPPQGWNLMGLYEAEGYMQEAGRLIQAVDSSYVAATVQRPGLHTTASAFMLGGIPSMQAATEEAPRGVPEADPDGQMWANQTWASQTSASQMWANQTWANQKITEEELQRHIRTTAMLLYLLAGERVLPALPYDNDQLKDFLLVHKLQEELLIYDRWLWD